MKINRCRIITVVLFAFVAIELVAQVRNRDEFDAYAKRQREAFAQYKADRQTEFNRYREQYNREFAGYLRQAWKQVRPKEKIAPSPQPKPFVPKPAVDDSKPRLDSSEEMPVLEIVKPQTVQPAPKPIAIEKPKENRSQSVIHLQEFYGHDITLHCSSKVKIPVVGNTLESIASAWEKIAVWEMDPLVYDCQQTRVRLGYCDWMYYQFVKEIAHIVSQTGKGSNEEVLLTGYILAQSGIDFRFARNGNRLLLALPFDSQVYGFKYFSIGNKNYYIVEKEVEGSCYLMDKSFSKEAAILTLRISTAMDFGGSEIETKVLTSKKYPEMSVRLPGNKSLMRFFDSYPRMDWQVYSLAPLNEEVAKCIMNVFRQVLAGKSEEEAVNMILNFVQTAFTYGYDDKIWGGDRPFFADETLYYPYSDCEDRSILFSHLIRALTNLDVVLLHYPNHLATAVRFSRNLPGDYVMVGGQKYLVCDPTGYKSIGNAYDEFKNVQAKVIKIK